ncbi:MAG: C25 family cysteine peptidase, partial [Bacteroidales bacterium]
ETINHDGTLFDRLSLVGGIKDCQFGSPEIPSIQKLLAIPECKGEIISHTITDSLVFNHYNVYPKPEIVNDSSNGKVLRIESFVYDSNAYLKNTYTPQTIVGLHNYGYIRSQRVAQIYINPVRFNPITHSLITYSRINITIKFKNPSSNINVNAGIFNNVLSHALINYKSDGTSAKSRLKSDQIGNVDWVTLNNQLQQVSDASNIVADYLIITDDQYDVRNQNIESLANQRAQFNGYDVAIVSKSNIFNLPFNYDQTHPWFMLEQKIRSFIQLVYNGNNAHHTYDGKLAYVVLIGKSYTAYGPNGQQSSPVGVTCSFDNTNLSSVPAQYLNGNDYYYSCITPNNNNGGYDPYGDLYIGRLSVHNENELFNIIHKTISNETFNPNNTWQYRTNSFYCLASGDDPRLLAYYEGCTYPYIDSLANPPYHSYEQVEPITAINNGTNTYLYMGHSNTYAWMVGGIYDSSYFKTHLLNNGQYPFIIAHACLSGTYFYTPDCLGEEFVKNSSNSGAVGYLGYNSIISLPIWSYYPPDCGPKLNYLFDYIYQAIYQNLAQITGEFILEAKLTEPLNDGNQSQFNFNLLGDPALNLFVNDFWITEDTHLCNSTISTQIYVPTGQTLYIDPDCDVYFEDAGQIIVDGGTLVIGDHARIHGKTAENVIYVQGIVKGTSSDNPPHITNATFTSIDNNDGWVGFELCNTSLPVVFDGCTFNSCNIIGIASSVKISNSTFTNSNVSLTETNFELHNSNLTNSYLDLEAYNSNSYSAIIDNNCTFTNNNSTSNSYVIKFIGYTSFNISYSTLLYNEGTGISLTNCGWYGPSNSIFNCTIQKTTNPQNLSWGILAYNTSANINNNFITQNRFGISSINSSNVSIMGNSSAKTMNQTQRIINNNLYQILAYDNSFPYYLHYNQINNSNSNYLIY